MEIQKIKVGYLPMQSFSLAFGGFEVQMLIAASLFEKDSNIEIIKVNPWEKNYKFNIVHFWGCSEHHFVNFKWAKSAGLKTVITTLLPYFTIRDYLKIKLKGILGLDAKIKYQYSQADKIVVLNQDQAYALKRFYHVPDAKIAIIRNTIFNDFLVSSVPSRRGDTVQKYFLCIGNISKRKNQLFLSRELSRINQKCIFVGSKLMNEELYYNKFISSINEGGLHEHIEFLVPGSQELAFLYKNCAALILLSEEETQPITIVEALYFGCKVILPEKKWSRQFRCFGNVFYFKIGLDKNLSWEKILMAEYPDSRMLFNSLFHPAKVKDDFKFLYSNLLK